MKPTTDLNHYFYLSALSGFLCFGIAKQCNKNLSLQGGLIATSFGFFVSTLIKEAYKIGFINGKNEENKKIKILSQKIKKYETIFDIQRHNLSHTYSKDIEKIEQYIPFSPR